ncbi:MAG: fibronectin type III domain-containing protein, partial [Anaerolineae bacterium]
SWAKVWSSAWALGVVLSLVLGPLPLAGAPVAESDLTARAADTQAESPGDALVVSWAQADVAGERTILLQWPALYRHFIYLPLTVRGGTQSASFAAAVAASAADATTDGYSIWRRLAGQVDWGYLGTAGPVTTPDDLVTVLGQDLVDQLCLDLRADPDDPALTLKQLFERLRRDPALVKMLQGQYYQVGLAMGTSYLDRGATEGATLEYRVLPLRGSLQFTPARVPSAASSLPTPTGVREVWTGPAGLGVRPSSRPNDADERFSWIGAQAFRPWDGTVYLIWDIPTDTGSLDDGLTAFNLAGYRIYRAPSVAGPWEKVNPTKADCAHPGSIFCEILTGLMLPPETQDGFPQFFFKEDLREVIADPAQLYRSWTYKVCPVDGLRNEGLCSAPVSVPVRELMPPAPAHDLTVQPNPQLTQLQLTWVYSDTGDVSQPLRFYVTRSVSLTAQLNTWTPVTPTNGTVPYQEVVVTGPVTLTVTDVPPKDQVYWYRVQVRDNAGNWSAPGQAAKGALYTRTDPSFGPVPGYNPTDCAANDLPLTLSGLSAEVRQIVVYRGFDPGGPWHLVKRVTVGNGVAVITDEYVPPYATDVFYRLEAVDGHGNVSAAQPYCAQLDGSDILPPPPPITTTVTQNDTIYVWTAEVGDTGTPDESQPPTVITVTVPGEDGPISQSLPVTGTASGEIPSGAWIEIDGSTTGSGGTGASSESWLRVTNNFIDTERQMTDLGGLHELRWEVSQTGTPFVEVGIVTMDEWSPPLALFRRIPGGSWLQVTEVRRVQPHLIEDHSDPSPYQTYEYAVLLFSPTTYEVMGYWGPATLAALYPAQTLSLGGDTIVPVAQPYPDTCTITENLPGSVGMPPTIGLANGWVITNVVYYTSTVHGCPPFDFSSANAYGRGLLLVARNVYRAVTFYGIAVPKGVHTAGKIVAPLNYSAAAGSAFARQFGQIEFTAEGASQWSRAEVTITLPSNIRIRTGSGDASRVAGIFDTVTSGLAFDPGYPPGTLVDENLPWRLSGTEMAIDERAITFGAGDVTTTYRLDYGPDATLLEPGDPDNNLA